MGWYTVGELCFSGYKGKAKPRALHLEKGGYYLGLEKQNIY